MSNVQKYLMDNPPKVRQSGETSYFVGEKRLSLRPLMQKIRNQAT
jgi:hypothetical protein